MAAPLERRRQMKLVVFGLTVSSSWGNGHATLWRGLIRALVALGHQVTFFERDVPYYAANRDLHELEEGAALILYPSWDAVAASARQAIHAADVSIVTSYCPDARDAYDLLMGEASGLKVFYDLDTPVTLARLAAGEAVPYVPAQGLGAFDLVLSYTGGEALRRLGSLLGARHVAPLYGHVDPAQHRRTAPVEVFRADLSYIGTYAADRQAALEALFVAPARTRPTLRFVLAGSSYPPTFPWTNNIFFVSHLPPPDHAAFYSSSRVTLNVTRSDMAAMGHCPSGRLFEAAACGTPVLSDVWPGLDGFFEPGSEILVARTTEDALAALDLSDAELRAISKAARERVLDEHTSMHRARTLIDLIRSSDRFIAWPDADAGLVAGGG
jgi:spore maturation protein CgeB